MPANSDFATRPLLVLAAASMFGCGGAQPPPSDSTAAAGESAPADPDTAAAGGDDGDLKEFKIRDSEGASEAHGEHPSKIEPTETEAALKFFVVDKDKGPIEGIVIALTAPTGKKYYTEETDAKGYAEVLVPAGQTYKLVYLSLGRQDVSAKVKVDDEPNLSLKLTLRYKRHEYADGDIPDTEPDADKRFVLKGVQFASGKATLTPDSRARLDQVVEYMTHKKSARIQISGHTDNVGNPRRNKALSQKRAEACRAYLVSQGIERSRIEAIGYGDEKPIASNDTEEGRQKNRRIEAMEM